MKEIENKFLCRYRYESTQTEKVFAGPKLRNSYQNQRLHAKLLK